MAEEEKEEKKFKRKLRQKTGGEEAQGGETVWKVQSIQSSKYERKTLGGLYVQYMCPKECSRTRK